MNIRHETKRTLARRVAGALFALAFAVLSSGMDPSLGHASTSAAPTPQGQGPQRERPSKTEHFQRMVDLVDRAGRRGEMGSASNLHKLDQRLQDLLVTGLQRGDVRGLANRTGVLVSGSDRVLVDIYVHGDLASARSNLESLGMDVVATSEAFGGIVEGYLPADALLSAAGSDSTKALLPVRPSKKGTGSVTSQGDAAHDGPEARLLGLDGEGVVVGIISDSMNQVGTKLAGSQAGGDLPAGVTVLLDDTVDATDEGRAMAEIIYDTAPGITSMYFSSGTTGGPAAKASSISSLVSNGVDIIADDIGYWGEPFFQDGVVAQAVDAAYTSGVAYFAAAGNYARQSYEQTYRSMGLIYSGYGDYNDEPHDFDPGGAADPWQTIVTVQNGECLDAVLQWDDPWGAAHWDFDWYLYQVGGGLLAQSFNDNVSWGLPYENLYWCNNSGSAVTVENEIDWWHQQGYTNPKPNTTKLKYLTEIEYGSTFSIAEYNTSSPTVFPDAAAANGAMAVAAVWYDDVGLNDATPYSSRGPVTRYFNTSGVRFGSPQVRQKPQVAGADCVITSSTFAGGLPFGGTEFCGTSAAAPSVAGVAALALQANPSLTPAQLYAILGNASNTIDCTAAGNPDADCGYGFVLAENAVTAAGNSAYWYGSATITADRNVVAVGRPHVGSEVASYGGFSSSGLTAYLPMLFKNSFGGAYDSAFYVQNTDDTNTATISIKYYDSLGANTCTVPDTVAPLSSKGYWVPSESCLPVGWVGGAVVTSDWPIVAVGRPHVGSEVMTYGGFTAGSTSMYLPMLFKNAWGSYNSAFYIQNVDPTNTAHVTIKYMDSSGAQTCDPAPTDTIDPRASHGYWVPDISCLPDGWVGGVVIESDWPVVAVGRPHIGTQVTTYDGFPSGTIDSYVPMLFKNAFGGSYDAALYIQNVDSADAHVTIKYYDSAGALTCTHSPDPDTIAPLASHGYWLPAECPPVGWVGGALITSDKNVVAVGRPHVGSQVTTYNGFSAGSSVSNLPMLFKNMWGSYQSAFYIQNTESGGAANGSVKYYDVNGNLTCTRTFSIPALATSGIWVPSVVCLH